MDAGIGKQEATATARVLWVTAVEAEAKAVAAGLGAGPGGGFGLWVPRLVGDGHAVVVGGVGKAGAAGATAWACRHGLPEAIVSIGVGGVLSPKAIAEGAGVGIGDVVAGSRSVDADEGVLTPGGFVGVSEMGFPPGPNGETWFEPSENLVAAFEDAGATAGVIATVSTGSGTDPLRDEVIRQTGAVVEAMEGAAVLRVAAVLGVPAIEVRAVSNTTGNRDIQVWDLPRALAALSEVVSKAAHSVA